MRKSTAQKYRRHRKTNLTYGGDLRNTRLGRSTARPLSTNQLLHLVLRSTQARGPKSFCQPNNRPQVEEILGRFARRYGVIIYDRALHHNHIHLAIQLSAKETYANFIRSITLAIAIAVSGSRNGKPAKKKFWDHRPYTRVVRGPEEEANLADYLLLNRLEAEGLSRKEAREHIRDMRAP